MADDALLKCITYRDFEYRVSPVALGELFLLVRKPGWEDYLGRIARLVYSRIRPYVPHRDELICVGDKCYDFPSIFQEVLGVDNRISIDDALIVTYAFIDAECTGLVTTDKTILGSKRLNELAGKLGKRLVGPDWFGCGE